MGNHHGDEGEREREMEREREEEKRKKKQEGGRRKMVGVGVMGPTKSGTVGSDMRGEWERKRENGEKIKDMGVGKNERRKKMENEERNRKKIKKMGRKKKGKWELLWGWKREGEERENK